MGMKRFCISMSQDDIDRFELGREAAGMNKSAYVRLLIAEHENVVPGFYKNKELIRALSDLNNSVNELIAKDTILDSDKILIFEKMRDLALLVKENKL